MSLPVIFSQNEPPLNLFTKSDISIHKIDNTAINRNQYINSTVDKSVQYLRFRTIKMRISFIFYTEIQKKDAQLSQRDCTAGCVSFGQKWKTGTGRQYFRII